MTRLLAISLCVLLLSGCIAEWKNPNGPTRWSGQPDIQSMGNSGAFGTPPLDNPGSAPPPPPPPAH
jgi:hypothetical protein